MNRITIFAFIPEILLPYPEGLPHPTSHRPTPTHTLTYCSLILMVCPTLHPIDPPLHTLSHTAPLSWWSAPPYIPPTHPYTHNHILLPYPDGLPHPTSHRPTPTHTLTYCSLILMVCPTLHPTDPSLHTLTYCSLILMVCPTLHPTPTHTLTYCSLILMVCTTLHATEPPLHTLSHTAPLSWWPAPPYIPPTHPYTHTHILLPYPDGLPHPTSHRPTPTHTLTYCSLILMVCPTLHPTDPPLHTHSLPIPTHLELSLQTGQHLGGNLLHLPALCPWAVWGQAQTTDATPSTHSARQHVLLVKDGLSQSLPVQVCLVLGIGSIAAMALVNDWVKEVLEHFVGLLVPSNTAHSHDEWMTCETKANITDRIDLTPWGPFIPRHLPYKFLQGSLIWIK